MDPNQQRIEIAKACGWKLQQDKFPDYVNDLNAMHEAEALMTSRDGWNFQCGYTLELRQVVLRRRESCNAAQTDHWMIHATAAQRAEAFLRTIGKWIEIPKQP